MKTNNFKPVLSILATLFLLSGCGGGSGSASPSSAPAAHSTDSPPPVVTPSPTPVVIPTPVSSPTDLTNLVHLQMASQISMILGTQDPLSRLNQISSTDLSKFEVQMEYPAGLPKGSVLLRRIGHSDFMPVALTDQHPSNNQTMIGVDDFDVGPIPSLDPVPITYQWQVNGVSTTFNVVAKRSWILDSVIDAKGSLAFSHTFTETLKKSDELELEYFIIRAQGKLILKDQDFKVRSQWVMAETGASLVSFDPASPPSGADSNVNSGSVYFQADNTAGYLTVKLDGAPGLDGTNGLNLPPSAVGANGSNATTSIHPQRMGEPGQPPDFVMICTGTHPGTGGGPGPAGNPGSDAGPGGNAGSFILRVASSDHLTVNFSSLGGFPGKPGIGSPGGPGGRGGASHDGDPCGYVSGGPNGPQGPKGADGKDAQRGISGVLVHLPTVGPEADLDPSILVAN